MAPGATRQVTDARWAWTLAVMCVGAAISGGPAGCRRAAEAPGATDMAPATLPTPATPTAPPPAVPPAAVARTAVGAKAQPGATLAEDPTRTALLAEPHASIAAVVDWSSVLRPCGCTVELQRGGVERLLPFLRAAAAADPALAIVHAGALLTELEPPRPGEGAQRALRQRTFVQLLRGLPIAAVAVSSEDLRQGGEAVRGLLAGSGLPLLAEGWQTGLPSVRSRLLHRPAGQAALGLFALDPAAGALDAQIAAATAQVAALRGEGAVRVVALSNLGLRQSRRLARAVAGLDAIVVGAVPERFEPAEAVEREGAVFVLEAPRQGAAAALLTLPAEATDPRFAYRSVALPWSEPTDPEVTAAVRAYDAAAATANREALARPLPATEGAARYLGQDACLGCHAAVRPFAAADRHSHAFDILRREGKDGDVDCVGCHVTGWQRPGGSAFANLETLQHVQCEACHGPGSLHVALADKAAPLAGFVRRPGEAACVACHSAEHSPRFDLAAWRARLLVPGHGLPAAR